MNYGLRKFWFEAIETRGYAGTAGCMAWVYDMGTMDLATIYSDDQLTAMTNPISETVFDAAEKVEFWAAAGTYDVTLMTMDGGHLGRQRIYPWSDHRMMIEVYSFHGERMTKIPYMSQAGTIINTGLVTRPGMVITRIFAAPITAGTAMVVAVGTLGDTDAFCSSIDCSATAVYAYAATSVIQGTPIIINTTATVALQISAAGSALAATRGYGNIYVRWFDMR